MGGVRPGTDEGNQDQHSQSDDRQRHRHVDGGLGQQLLGGDEDGYHGHPDDAHDPALRTAASARCSSQRNRARTRAQSANPGGTGREDGA